MQSKSIFGNFFQKYSFGFQNMHSPDYFSASVCHAGCKCKEGYVLDTRNKICVKPAECPCHHGGRSYKENSTIQNDCNTWYFSLIFLGSFE